MSTQSCIVDQDIKRVMTFEHILGCLSGIVLNREEFQTVTQRKLILISLDWTRPQDPLLSFGSASILAILTLMFFLVRGVHDFGNPDLGLSTVTELDTLPPSFVNKFIPSQWFIDGKTKRGCQNKESDVTINRH
ncbi:41523_t:CDS:2 [Gigaspora margarita]|uniref:41523_t:CDS:1 n=1 Tax=Gigaspora margarita TaxID=4874 RepID=A0ABN7UIZ1_GIGMA|nr:41523_t:CDS:2 [Gigaspora margarita]